MKSIFRNIITLFVSISIALLFAELMLYLFYPQPIMYPVFKFSKEYGYLLPENTIITHELRGKWKYHYHINNLGYRGKLVNIAEKYNKNNIVVLGDSYSMGMGVDEGEQYAAIMDSILSDYNVINLGVGAWGLTQEIRRFYELGQLYKPAIVILQFCRNDRIDNIHNKVTVIEDNKFKFINSTKIREPSFLYNSMLYKLVRKNINKIRGKWMKKMDKNESIFFFYNELLSLFVNNLHKNGTKVIIISVNNQLNNLPLIKTKVKQLQDDGLLDYVEVAAWFKGVEDFGSPEGHKWGKKAHGIIGENLSKYINSLQKDSLEKVTNKIQK